MKIAETITVLTLLVIMRYGIPRLAHRARLAIRRQARRTRARIRQAVTVQTTRQPAPHKPWCSCEPCTYRRYQTSPAARPAARQTRRPAAAKPVPARRRTVKYGEIYLRHEHCQLPGHAPDCLDYTDPPPF